MTQAARGETWSVPLARPATPRTSWTWLGVLPFFVFTAAFLLLPFLFIVRDSFLDAQSHPTLANVLGLRQPFIVRQYWTSIQISAVTALVGLVFGFFLAAAAVAGGVPSGVRSVLMTFCGVASNFAGVPLAFAFIATLGRQGLVTGWLKTYLHDDIYRAGFSLYTFWGLSLVYAYFQLPLMVLIIAPALDGMRREWREAAMSLGASGWQYWRYVALPILFPPLLGAAVLLFGNAFGAYATAYALTGGRFGLVPIVIGQQITGDVLHNPGLGNALALGMVVVMAVCMATYALLQRRSTRWVRA